MALIDVLDRVEGELGPVKSNDPAHPFTDPSHQLAAAEWNTAAEAIIDLQEGHNAQETALTRLAYAPVTHATNANVTEGQAALFLLASGSRTATIINPRVGARVLVKIHGGTSGNQLTVDPAGGGTVDGASSLVLTQDNEAVELLCVAYAETSEWVVTSRAIIPEEGGGGGGDGNMIGPGSTEPGKLVVWDSGDGTSTAQADVVWDAGVQSLSVPVLALPNQPGDPTTPSGGHIYTKDDGVIGTMLLHYQNDDGYVTRVTTVQGAVAGTATQQAGPFSSSDTVFDGQFALFDLATAGTSLTATLDLNAPVGSHCVVKILGAASSFQLDIVDGAAQNIDGVATYTLTADNASARLTKMSDTTWAVG